jgi:transcriptional regulator GlxA family with amidase domain
VLDPDRIWLRDGNIYTSAGVTSGMDLALALVEEDLGSKVALAVARQLVLFFRRPGGQSQFSRLLEAQASTRRHLREVLVCAVENLDKDLSAENLEEIASACGFSSAELMRRAFLRLIGITPSEYRQGFRSAGV